MNGSGTGTFTSNISGLNPLTTYFMRAFTITNFDTVYGIQVSFSTIIEIGNSYAGGIVFYLNGGSSGLVCTPSDQSTGAEWGCNGSTIGGTSTSLGTGEENTTRIVSQCPETGIAARICYNLVLNGYGDWFLPSKDELNKIYVNLKLAGIGGFANDWYWSSSEYSTISSWVQSFNNGYQSFHPKDDTKRVRAVRSF
jgi:hypothetical protein